VSKIRHKNLKAIVYHKTPRRLLPMVKRLYYKAIGFHDKLLKRKTLVHFLHIGKTGGSNLRDTLSTCESTVDMLEFHGHGCRLADIPKGQKVVAVVREPESRFISAFYGRQREDRPRYHVPWSEGEKKAFETFANANDLALALESDSRTMRSMAEQAMKDIQHVRQPLCYYLGDLNYFLKREADIFFIGFQNNLDADAERLVKKLKLPNLKLSNDPVIAHSTKPNDKSRLTQEAKDILAKFYKKDVEIYEYLLKKYANAG